jgi:hypothetical protein
MRDRPRRIQMKHCSNSSSSEGSKRKKIKGRKEKAEMGTGWF